MIFFSYPDDIVEVKTVEAGPVVEKNEVPKTIGERQSPDGQEEPDEEACAAASPSELSYFWENEVERMFDLIVSPSR